MLPTHLYAFTRTVTFWFLGSFPKFWKATIIFVMSVRPSIRQFSWNNSDLAWWILMKLHTRAFYRKSVEKIKFLLKSVKNNGYFTWKLFTFMTSRSVIPRMRGVSNKCCREIKTHILRAVKFSRKSCRLLDNVEKYGRTREIANDDIAACCMLNK
jgi:hypothetical protein